jgi:hypothetical protein
MISMMKKIILLIILLPFIAFTQNNMTENEQKMRDLIFQLLDSKDPRNLLESNQWSTRSLDDFIAEDNNQYYSYTFEKYYPNQSYSYFIINDYSSTTYQNELTLITEEEFYKKFYNLIIGSGYKQKDKLIGDNEITTLVIKNDIEISFYEKLNQSHTITIYNTADKNKRKEVYFQNQQHIRNQVLETEKEIKIRITKGENAEKTDKYDDALSYYQSVSEILEFMPLDIKDSIDIYFYQNLLNQKISQTEALKEEKLIQNYLKKGNDYFYENKYNFALQAYNNVLKIDPLNEIADNQKKEIKEILEILENRNKVHSFKKIRLGYYNDLIVDLENGLEKIMNDSDRGNISITFVVHFDTLGNNLTKFYINSSENISKRIENSIVNLLEQKKNDISSRRTMVNQYYISSKENININLEWSTDKISVKITPEKTTPDLRLIRSANNYISSLDMYGKYYISQKNKRVNSNSTKDFFLTDHSINGPSNVLYSLLVPGLGTKKVTYGQKGNKRIKNFFFYAALGISAKLISNSYYSDYLNATKQEDIDKLYNNSATYHYIYLGGFTVCSTIYINELFGVISKGIKNKKKSRALKNKLKNGQIMISK